MKKKNYITKYKQVVKKSKQIRTFEDQNKILTILKNKTYQWNKRQIMKHKNQ